MSKNFFPPDSPTTGQPGAVGDAGIREQYGPKPGKKYNLPNSDDIFVEGWKFRFARAVMIPNVPKALTDRRWLGFSIYLESPPIPRANPDLPPYRMAQVIRGMRIYKGRLYPPMSAWAPGKWLNVMQFNETFALLIYEAIKQWSVVKTYPEFGVDGVKNPVNTLAYSRASVAMAMMPYTPGVKTISTSRPVKTKKPVDLTPEEL